MGFEKVFLHIGRTAPSRMDAPSMYLERNTLGSSVARVGTQTNEPMNYENYENYEAE